jgi:hypothetical protein
VPLLPAAIVALAALAFCGRAWAADPTAGSKASTNRTTRDAAARSIPLDKLPPDVRTRVAAVVENPSIFRRLPVASIHCDPDMYLMLIHNPEIVIDIWQLMGITNMSLVRTGENEFRAADGQGTSGTVQFVYRSRDTHIIYSTGMYDGSLSPARIRGESVVVLKSEYLRDPDGRPRINSQLDVFLHLDNVGIEWIARTLQPLLGRTADRNFAETGSFVSSLSHTAETNPAGVARLSNRLPHVDAATRQLFAEVSQKASDRADAIRQANNDAPVVRTTMRVTPASPDARRAEDDPFAQP